MPTQSTDFLKRIREQAASHEQAMQERFEAIMETPIRKSKPVTPSPSWVNTRSIESMGMEKASILDMLNGKVETKSSTRRDKPQR